MRLRNLFLEAKELISILELNFMEIAAAQYLEELAKFKNNPYAALTDR
jgi:hypothetical protein